MRSRAQALELVLLGLLSQSPLHGYELRKRITAIFGPFRALSFSVLYPQLRRMVLDGLIQESEVEATARRARIVYAITPKGAARFESLTDHVGADAWDDEGFEIRFALFSPTPRKSRVRVLEGRLRRLQEKRDLLHVDVERAPAGSDKYIHEWRRHSLESIEREISWLEEMIITEGKSK